MWWKDKTMNRREFLKAVIAGTAVVAMPSLAFPEDFRTLYGDGVHDDTDALSDLFAGNPVWYNGELRKATEALSPETGRVMRYIYIPPGEYLLRQR
jgi:hypothetical protein